MILRRQLHEERGPPQSKGVERIKNTINIQNYLTGTVVVHPYII